MKFGESREAAPAVATPEQVAEQFEKREGEPVRESAPAAERQDAKDAAAANAQPVVPSQAAASSAAAKDVYQIRVERVLEENLLDVYLSLPPAARARFKAEGEATALKLRVMFEKAKVRAKDVLHLILNWLKLIPGVNRYFLAQEAKIKTDKIILLAEERQKEKEGQI